MAHFTRTQPDATWLTGYTVQQFDLTSLDAKVFAAINGDEGGAYAPSTPIIINSTGGGGVQVTGPTTIANNATLTTNVAAQIILDTGDYPRLAPGHTASSRRLITSCASALPTLLFAARPHLPTCGLQVVAQQFVLSTGVTQPASWVLSVRTHNGATLSSATLTYRARTALPAPMVRMIRVDAGGIATPLTSTAAGADANGYMQAVQSTTLIAMAGETTFQLPCDQNNVIDRGTYFYMFQAIEQPLVGYPYTLAVRQAVDLATTVALAYDSTNQYFNPGLPIIDGVTVVAGNRILVKNNSPANNGIYIASGSPWQYAPDGDGSGDTKYPQGGIVPVNNGVTQAGTYWQLTSPTVGTLNVSPQNYGTIPSDPNATGNVFQAQGNLYLSVALDFSAITWTAFQ